ncbi:hypothetical protein [Burkholderia stagnalis]|uniref:hypothetical protein n=1 Tax=Burkholderia stagnalis TaxID=1503054 RepID=UPI000A789D51|nr:hypothetical protein [Burkholderia stagnalis]MDY7807248.1 hypothetical protein [Burkholderia stagnalis]
MNLGIDAGVVSVLVAFLTATNVAHAVLVTPPGPGGAPMAFSASSKATVSKSGIPIECDTTFTGTIDGTGKVKITSTSFGNSTLCKLVKGSASVSEPWTGQVDSPTQLTIDNATVEVSAPFIGGRCGPSKIIGTIHEADGATTIALDDVTLSGGCAVKGSLTTSPYLHVTH